MLKFISKKNKDSIHIIFLAVVMFVLDCFVMYGFSAELYRSSRTAMICSFIIISFNSILTYRAWGDIIYLWEHRGSL